MPTDVTRMTHGTRAEAEQKLASLIEEIGAIAKEHGLVLSMPNHSIAEIREAFAFGGMHYPVLDRTEETGFMGLEQRCVKYGSFGMWLQVTGNKRFAEEVRKAMVMFDKVFIALKVSRVRTAGNSVMKEWAKECGSVEVRDAILELYLEYLRTMLEVNVLARIEGGEASATARIISYGQASSAFIAKHFAASAHIKVLGHVTHPEPLMAAKPDVEKRMLAAAKEGKRIRSWAPTKKGTYMRADATTNAFVEDWTGEPSGFAWCTVGQLHARR